MLLKDKNAVIFAANGMISKGLAKAMAKHGAKVHLTGHRPDDLEEMPLRLPALWQACCARRKALKQVRPGVSLLIVFHGLAFTLLFRIDQDLADGRKIQARRSESRIMSFKMSHQRTDPCHVLTLGREG